MAVPWVEERRSGPRTPSGRPRARSSGTPITTFHTWRSVLKALGSKPGIIIEDDVALAPNWRNRIEGRDPGAPGRGHPVLRWVLT